MKKQGKRFKTLELSPPVDYYTIVYCVLSFFLYQKTMSSIIDHFSNLTDPRTKEHKKEHKLIDILFITIAAVICGAEDWNDIEFYGQEKEDWLKTILELPCGIPSHSLPRFAVIRSTGYC